MLRFVLVWVTFSGSLISQEISLQSRVPLSKAIANLVLADGMSGGVEVTLGCIDEPKIEENSLRGDLGDQLSKLAARIPELTWTIKDGTVRVNIGHPSPLSLIRTHLPSLSVNVARARIASEALLDQAPVQRAIEEGRVRLFATSPGFASLPIDPHFISLAPALVGDDLDVVAKQANKNVWIYSVRSCGDSIGQFYWHTNS